MTAMETMTKKMNKIALWSTTMPQRLQSVTHLGKVWSACMVVDDDVNDELDNAVAKGLMIQQGLDD